MSDLKQESEKSNLDYYYLILDDAPLSIHILDLFNNNNIYFEYYLGESSKIPYDKILEVIQNNGIIVYLSEYKISYHDEISKNELYIKNLYDKNIVPIQKIIKLILDYNINTKFIYLSNPNVFSGQRSNYLTYSEINPINLYGKSKATSEYITKMLPNYLIIRASYMDEHTFVNLIPYNDIIRDWLPIEQIKNKLYQSIIQNINGILHISGKRTNLLRLYKKHVNPDYNLKKIADTDIKYIIPVDLTLKDI